jgi:hypothetical protein
MIKWIYNDVLKFISGYIIIFMFGYAFSKEIFIEYYKNFDVNLTTLIFSYPIGILVQVLLEPLFPIKSNTDDRRVFLKHAGINIGSALLISFLLVIIKMIFNYELLNILMLNIIIILIIPSVLLNRRNLK